MYHSRGFFVQVFFDCGSCRYSFPKSPLTQWCLWYFLQIATQISVLIAKVARVDCPRQWPELIPTLVESVKVQDDLQQHRALLTFYHVTKTLASKRLAADRKLFYDVSNAMQYCTACKLCIVHACFFLSLAGRALMACQWT